MSAAEAPVSGVLANLARWRDVRLERAVDSFLHDPTLESAAALRDRILDAIEGHLPRVRTELADLETDWRRFDRGHLFAIGLAELDAERKAVAVYEGLLRRGAAATKRVLADANRRAVEAQQAEARARRMVDRSHRRLVFAAVNLAMADEGEWHRESDAGRALVAAVEEYRAKEGARAG